MEATGACWWPRGEHAAPAGEAHERLDVSVKVKEEGLDKEDTVHLEIRRQQFRRFGYQEARGPREVCSQLQELGRQWLKPEWCSKEQILELLFLEQFLMILPLRMQGWVKERRPETCSQAVTLAEDFLLEFHGVERTEQKIPELLGVVSIDSHKSEQNPADRREMDISLKAKQENNEEAICLLACDRQVRIRKEHVQLEGSDCLDAGNISRKRSKDTFSQDLEEEEIRGPKHCQEHLSAKPVEQTPQCKEHAGGLNERTFREGIQRRSRVKRATDNSKHLSHDLVFLDRKRKQKGEKLFKCSFCGKVSNGRTNLMIHERKHTGEKPYECSECGKSFSTTSNLINHKRVHTGEKPYTCSDCGQSFSHNASLIRHRRTHTGEKPYECSDCSKSFIQKGELIAHKRTHTGEKPYKCAECGKSFSTSSHLIRHKRVHTGGKPQNCSDCRKSFHKDLHRGTYTDNKKQETGRDWE